MRYLIPLLILPLQGCALLSSPAVVTVASTMGTHMLDAAGEELSKHLGRDVDIDKTALTCEFEHTPKESMLMLCEFKYKGL